MKLPKMRIREECKKLFKMGKYAKKKERGGHKKGGNGEFFKKKNWLAKYCKKNYINNIKIFKIYKNTCFSKYYY